MIRRAAAVGLLAAAVGCAGSSGRPSERSPVDTLVARGDSLYQVEEFDSARAVWVVALRQAEVVGDSVRMARILTELGLVDYRRGDLPDARAAQERAVALGTRHHLGDSILSRSYNGLGLVAEDEGRNQEAIRHFERAIETARAARDDAALARASGNIGLALQNLGELDRARAAHRTLREAGQRLGNRKYEANGLLNEASLDIWEGDPVPAIARLDTARRYYREVGYRTGEEWALGQLATARELTGELDRAFAALDSALILARDRGLEGEAGDNLRLIADLHAQTGDWRRAIRYYQQADSLFRTSGFEGARGAALRGAAAAYLALGNARRARAEASEASRLHAASGEVLEQLDDLLLLATIETNADPAGAARHLASARRLAGSLNTRGAQLLTALGEARYADRLQSPRRVLATVDAASRDLTPGDLWAEWELNALAARAEARLGRLDSAVARGRRAVRAIERQRNSLGSDALRATMVTERAEVYGDLVLALLQLGRTDEAFAAADAARSRGLLEHLAAVRAGRIQPELLRGEELLRQIDRLMRRIRDAEPTRPEERAGDASPAQDSIVRALAAARSEYEALVTRVAEGSSPGAAVLGAVAVRIDDVRQALDENELLLEYLITSDRLIIFVVRRDGIRVLEHPADAFTLRHQVQLLRELWGSPAGDWRLGLPAAAALYQAIVAPVRDAHLLDGHRRLLIVPHGVLAQLPFAALRDPATDRFLVEDYAVAHLPSAAALAALRRRVAASSETARGQGFAPFPEELPASAGEVGAFRSALHGAVIRLGGEATEAGVRRALGESGLVHVATHGTLNAPNPMFSRIELARPRAKETPSDDGRLEVHELLGMEIRSPVVFFSGCETGAGQPWSDDPVRGTADLTLAQAALSAGAGNVISTLWRVRDAGAAAFADRFYASLQHGSVSAALAAAQRETLADPKLASPFYWAGYVLSGEGRFGEHRKN